MSKTRIFALLLIILMLAAVFTNPTKERIEAALTVKAKEILEKQLNSNDKVMSLGMTLFGDRVVNEFVSNYTHTDNYYLFSLSKIRWNSEDIIIGVGLFNQVWISPKIDEKAAQLMDQLKKI